MKWEMVYATRDLSDYYRIMGALKNVGLKPRTKTISAGAGTGNGHGFECNYQIFVPVESIHRAEESLKCC